MGPSHVKFSRNWNNKFSCEFFTTFRLHNPNKYAVGTTHEIWLCDKQIGKGRVVAYSFRDSKTVTDTEAFLDAGMNAAKLLAMLCTMYKRPANAVLALGYVTFQMVERYEK